MPLTSKYDPRPSRNKPRNPKCAFAVWNGPMDYPKRTKVKPKDRSAFELTAIDLIKNRIASQKRACLMTSGRATRDFRIKAMKRELRIMRRA